MEMEMENTEVEVDTFQEACRRLGLLDGNQEWENVLEEVSNTASSPQLRALYIIILMFCEPSNPRSLFDKFWEMWTDDIETKAMKKGVNLDPEQKRQWYFWISSLDFSPLKKTCHTLTFRIQPKKN